MEHNREDDQPLRGMRILVVDDEFLIAVTIEETLRDAGAEIVNAATLPAALSRVNEATFSAALLDIRLGRHTTEEIADALAARAIPFLFYSGQALPDRMREKYPHARVLVKPVGQEVFVRALLGIVTR